MIPGLYADTGLDFYKTGHRLQYPEGTSLVYSNFTCRSDVHANVLDDFDHKTVFFGLQAVAQFLLIDFWNRTFFHRPKEEAIARYKRRMDLALGPNNVGTEHIAALHDLGYLPILIKAVPEGSRVNIRVPSWTIRNTRPEFFWLTNYLETQLSAELWLAPTSATTSYEYRRMFDRFAQKTGSPKEFVPWQGHDFSMRGMQNLQASAMSGAAHLLSFTGTDTVAALDFIEEYYGQFGAARYNYDDPSVFELGRCKILGGSVPATEHSVMCMGGPDDGEVKTFTRLLSEVYPTGIVSIVSDTWDFWNIVTNVAKEIKPVSMSRNGKCVFRPDSGDPVLVICGDPEAKDGTPQQKGAVQCLWETFGGTETSTGHRALDGHVGLIYGDSITLERAQEIVTRLDAQGFASCNVVFGIGSLTFTHVTRDTLGSAIKSTYGEVNGEPREIFKDPKTDDGVKKSARGLIRVEKEGNDFVLYDRQTWEQEGRGALEPVFQDGKLMRYESFDTIRKRLHPAWDC